MRSVYRTGLVLLLAPMMVVSLGAVARGQTEWWYRSYMMRSKYYNIKTDLPKEQSLELARHMDITCEAYIGMFSGMRAWRRQRLDLYFFATQVDYLQTLQKYFKIDGSGSWGLCISQGDATSIVGWRGSKSLDSMKSLLQHEGFHQFARTLFPKMPVWANEGIAENFERGVVIGGKLVLGEVSTQDRMRLVAAADRHQFKPLAELFTMDSSQWGGHVKAGQAHTNYLQVWSVAHFFFYAENARYQPQFLAFLANLNRGSPWRQAFVAAFGDPDIGVIERKWLAYVGTVAPTDYRETIARLEFLAKGVETLREKKQYPASFDELKEAMGQIDFTRTSTLFGQSREMKATDAKLFEVPFARESTSKLVFQLVDRKGKKLKYNKMKEAKKSSRKKSASRRAPPLPMLITEGLEPRNFAARWVSVRRGKYKLTLVAE